MSQKCWEIRCRDIFFPHKSCYQCKNIKMYPWTEKEKKKTCTCCKSKHFVFTPSCGQDEEILAVKVLCWSRYWVCKCDLMFKTIQRLLGSECEGQQMHCGANFTALKQILVQCRDTCRSPVAGFTREKSLKLKNCSISGEISGLKSSVRIKTKCCWTQENKTFLFFLIKIR